MVSKNTEFRVGLTILVGIAILAGSLYWLESFQLEKNLRLIRVSFGDVGTLAAGDKVTVSGVHKGKVSQLHLSGRGVEVEILLAQDVILKHDASFVIKNLGLMGERFIAISPGVDSLPFDNTQIALGAYDTGLPEVMGLLGEMIIELRHLVGSFTRTVGSDSSLSKFDAAIDNLNRLTFSLAGYMERNERKLDATADNFLAASISLRKVVENNSRRVDSSLKRIDQATIHLAQFVDHLDSLSASALEFAEFINTSEGTFHLLMEDRRLYDDLRKTADNIDDLITDIRAHPSRYINLKLELF